MHWLIRIACIAAFLGGISIHQVAQAEDPKTGPFETTFTERSPLSDIKSLATRLKLLNRGDKLENLQDYDISKEGWWVYVPEKYDPAKPMGLIVLALYKHADSLPQAVLPQLADANVALIVPNEYLDTWWKRAGLMLDAAYNMQKQYKIDPKRVYVFGSTDWPDTDGKNYTVANMLGLFYPEVFTGVFVASNLKFYRRAAGMTKNSYFNPDSPRLEVAQGLLACKHPWVVGSPPNTDYDKAGIASYKADGFKNLTIIPVTTEQYHYPNFTTDWLPAVLKYMDAATADLQLSTDTGKASPTPPTATKN